MVLLEKPKTKTFKILKIVRAMNYLFDENNIKLKVKGGFMTTNQIEFMKASEQARHNRVVEEHEQARDAETARHQMSVETETARTNLANEQIRQQANTINDNHYQRMDAETNRHNTVVETETERSNRVREEETERNNRANEAIGRERNAISRESNAIQKEANSEIASHNRSMEVLQAQSNATAQQRANQEGQRITNDFVTSVQANDNAAQRNAIEQSKVQIQRDKAESEIALNEARAGQATASMVRDYVSAGVQVIDEVGRLVIPYVEGGAFE